MTLYVSISRAIIANNAKNGRNDPPFEIRTAKDGKPDTVHVAEFSGNIRLIYDPANPLVSKAVCWIEIEPASDANISEPAHAKVIDLSVVEAAPIRHS